MNTISKQSIAHYLPKNPVIIEAGAHYGRDTIKMSKIWPQATIHAFEPVPELFTILKNNTQKHDNIFCYPYALSNSCGTKNFFVSSGRSTATSSLFEPFLYSITHPTTLFSPINVTTITLDQWAQKYAIQHADFLWLDMQGAELDALKGAENILKIVSTIYIEVNLIERYKNIPLYPEVKQWLMQQGFYVAEERFTHSQWGNVLFVR